MVCYDSKRKRKVASAAGELLAASRVEQARSKVAVYCESVLLGISYQYITRNKSEMKRYRGVESRASGAQQYLPPSRHRGGRGHLGRQTVNDYLDLRTNSICRA